MNYATDERAASKKVSSEFPKSPEGRLMFEIVALAINDLNKVQHRHSAIMYLLGPMPHAEICGVDPDWIRRILIKMRLI
jgi:hypothetical protein